MTMMLNINYFYSQYSCLPIIYNGLSTMELELIWPGFNDTIEPTPNSPVILVKEITDLTQATDNIQRQIQAHSKHPDYVVPILAWATVEKEDSYQDTEYYLFIAQPYQPPSAPSNQTILQAFKLLSQFHTSSIVHGNIKASNIFFTQNSIRLSDFGNTQSTNQELVRYLPKTQDPDLQSILVTVYKPDFMPRILAFLSIQHLLFNQFLVEYGQPVSHNQIMISPITNNVVKQITMTRSQWVHWKPCIEMEVRTQNQLAAQYPDQIVRIIAWSFQETLMQVIVYLVYDYTPEAKPIVYQLSENPILQEQFKLQLVEQVLQIGCVLYFAGVQHRNIKHSNLIFINGRIKLTDFGSARTHYLIYGQQATSKAVQQWQHSAYYYLCPELIKIQLQDELEFREDEWLQINADPKRRRVVYERNDQWALGVLLIQMLTDLGNIKVMQPETYYANNTDQLKHYLTKISNENHVAIFKCIEAIMVRQCNMEQTYEEFAKNAKLDDKGRAGALQQVKDDKKQSSSQIPSLLQRLKAQKFEYKLENKDVYFIPNLQRILDDPESHSSELKLGKMADQPKTMFFKENQMANELEIVSAIGPVNDPELSQYNAQINTLQFQQNGDGVPLQIIRDGTMKEQGLQKYASNAQNLDYKESQPLMVIIDSQKQTKQQELNQYSASREDMNQSNPNQFLTKIEDELQQGNNSLNRQKGQVNQLSAQEQAKLQQLEAVNDPQNLKKLSQYNSRPNDVNYNNPNQLLTKIEDEQQQQGNNNPNRYKAQINQLSAAQEQAQQLEAINDPQNLKKLSQHNSRPDDVKYNNSNQLLTKIEDDQQQQSNKNQNGYKGQINQLSAAQQQAQQLQAINDPQNQQKLSQYNSRPNDVHSNSNQGQVLQRVSDLGQQSQFQKLGDHYPTAHQQGFNSNNNSQGLLIIEDDQEYEQDKLQIFRDMPQTFQQSQASQLQQVQDQNGQRNQISLYVDSPETLNKNNNHNVQILDAIRDERKNSKKLTQLNNESSELKIVKFDDLVQQNDVVNQRDPANTFSKYQGQKNNTQQQQGDQLLQIVDENDNSAEQSKFTGKSQQLKYGTSLQPLNDENINMQDQRIPYDKAQQQIIGLSQPQQSGHLQRVIEGDEQQLPKMSNNIAKKNENLFGLGTNLEPLNDKPQLQDSQMTQIQKEQPQTLSQNINDHLVQIMDSESLSNKSSQNNKRYNDGSKQHQHALSLNPVKDISYIRNNQKQTSKNSINLYNTDDNDQLLKIEQDSLANQSPLSNNPDAHKKHLSYANQLNRIEEELPTVKKSNTMRLQTEQTIVPMHNKHNQIHPCNEFDNAAGFSEQHDSFHPFGINFDLWSTNKLIRKFQVFKRSIQEPFPKIPDELMDVANNEQLMEVFENRQIKYSGYTLDRVPHGRGRMMKKYDGGGCLGNKPHGAIYEGIFKEGKFVWGMVLELNPKGELCRYIGGYNVQYQRKHGLGRMEWWIEEGGLRMMEWHEGQFVLGQIRGQGHRHYRNEDEYEGDWKCGLRNGRGELRFVKQEEKYVGEFKDGEFNGMGEYYHKDGIRQIIHIDQIKKLDQWVCIGMEKVGGNIRPIKMMNF